MCSAGLIRSMLVLLVGVLFGIDTATAQVIRGQFFGPFPGGGNLPLMRNAGADGQDTSGTSAADSDSAFPGGPSLKTDPEARLLLERAARFSDEGRHDLAAVLWQKVLDDSGDSLVSVDGRLYISLRQQVERQLAGRNEIALAAYRLTADGEAQALLAAAGSAGEEEALQNIVRRYFLSSLGDEAAWKLGCLALDRHDFNQAGQLFQRILDDHPDPSMPRGEVLVRLAVATGRLGDRTGAEQRLAQLAEKYAGDVSRSLMAAVKDDIAGTHAAESVGPLIASPALPTEVTARTLTEGAVVQYPLLFREMPLGFNFYDGRQMLPEPREADRDALVDQWREHGWMTAGNVLFHGDRVILKTHENVLCYLRRDLSRITWASLWNNEYTVDDYSRMASMVLRSMGVSNPSDSAEKGPQSAAEVFVFGDRIHHDLSLVGDLLCTIEGRRLSRNAVPEADSRAVQPNQFNTLPRRTRTNWLSAYDLRTGKVKWTRSAEHERTAANAAPGNNPVEAGNPGPAEPRTEDKPSGVGFMAAPVACGSLLLVPVSEGGTMKLLGLSRDTGRTLWVTDLCEEPEGGAAPWSPVAVAVAGHDAYVACGTGVVFSLDGNSGAVRWVVRYPRPANPLRQASPFGGTIAVQRFTGFTAETLVCHGPLLVVLASDCEQIIALDRRSGALAWESPRPLQWGTDVTYCLGVQGSGLFLAGPNAVRRYDLVSGKILWEREVDRSYGRGVLTENAIFLPVRDSVLRLDLATGKDLAQVGVRSTTNDPVGNLYSDGERLWMLSANRLAQLMPLDERLSSLEQRIAADDVAACWERCRLQAKLQRWDEARADVQTAYKLQIRQSDANEAAQQLLQLIAETRLTRDKPEFLLAILVDLFPGGLASLPEAARRSLEAELSACLDALPRQSRPGVVPQLLAAGPLLSLPGLNDKGAKSLKRLATAEDLPLLAKSVQQGGPAALMAAESYALLARLEARGPLATLTQSNDPRTQLAGVKGLLQTGDTAALPKLLALLEADEAEVRSRAYRTLKAATGETLPYGWSAPATERAGQLAAWKAWLAAHPTPALRLPLADFDALLGRTLVCSRLHSGLIVEIDSARNKVSERRIPMARAVFGLPNGNRLVSEPAEARLVEYNEKWEQVWKAEGFPTEVNHCDRAPDGTTLAVCAGTGQVFEIAPTGERKLIRQADDGISRPVFAKRLDNGNTLYCLQGANKVIEVTPNGKTVLEISNLVNPISAQRLDNGNTVVCHYSLGRGGRGGLTSAIVEFDAAGKEARRIRDDARRALGSFTHDDGRTLFIDMEGLHEIQADGKELWRYPLTGIISFSHF